MKVSVRLFEKFEISPFQQLPILLVFAKCDTGEILQRAIKITDTSIDNAASSLKKSLTSISDALQSVLDENLRNTLGVYSAVSLKLDHDDGWKIMKKGVNLWKELRSFI